MSDILNQQAHIALYLGELSGGGAERVMVNLAHNFAGRGIRVDLVLAAAQGPYLKDVQANINVIDLASGGVLSSLPKLITYLRQARPPALLTTLNHASIVALWAKKLARVNTRVFIREANTLSQFKGNTLKGNLLPQATKVFYPWADGIIAVSKGVAEDLKAFTGLSDSKVTAIYNPVVNAQLKQQAKEPLEHPWFKPDAKPVILSAGRLNKQKDFPTLLKAFARVRQHKDVNLMILGEGEERQALELLASELKVAEHVLFPGFMDNPFKFMANASLLVISSAWEGLPGVLIQAMACGCPVVSTDCPSGPAEVLDGGRFGPLVPVGDDAALAQAMLDTLENPLAAEVLKKRTELFSADRTTTQYLSLLLPEFNFSDTQVLEQV